MDCHCASRLLTALQVQTYTNVCHSAASTFSRHDVLLALVNRNSSSNLNGWSGFSSVQDSFWIRNEFQILSYCSAPDLGSAYGNQPYRSFREQTVPSPRAGDRAQRQHVCQHDRRFVQCVSQCFGRGIGRSLVLLRRRSWGRNPTVCSLQHASPDFTRSGDTCSFLLRRRSGRRNPALCSIYASQCFAGSGVDCTVLLRRRPGRRNPALCSFANRKGHPYTLRPVGRFSSGRSGQ